jgi:hypothetical protein
VGLEQGPLNLMRIIEELLEWKSSGSGSRKCNNLYVLGVSPVICLTVSAKLDSFCILMVTQISFRMCH